jgi:ectoine hydroxylase-related dioxygenase (phytanoyl-CoA dioxygenase family)
MNHSLDLNNSKDDILAKFESEGYLIAENVLMPLELEQLKNAIDCIPNNGHAYMNPTISKLAIHPKVLEFSALIFGGERFHFHHIHAARHEAGMPSLGWHHDYEQSRFRRSNKRMIHIFFYLSGLNGEIGDLLLVPKSHVWNVPRYRFSSCAFNHFSEIIRINKLAPGNLLIINSRLLHAREAQPGGENTHRYFLDMSLCEGGTVWPPYQENGVSTEGMLTQLRLQHAESEVSSWLFEPTAFSEHPIDKIIRRSGMNRVIDQCRKFLMRGNGAKRVF